MKILVIGSGGREHALVKALKKSPRVEKILVAPGNAGMEGDAEVHPIKSNDIVGLLRLARERGVDLTVVGPEQALTEGVVDAFQEVGLKIFGPNRRAAILEASKSFTKDFMKKYKIPTARYAVFADLDLAKKFLHENSKSRWVIKADGLAAGKGVFVTETNQEAFAAVDKIFVEKIFGKQSAVIEEFLEGEEASFMVICDGDHAIPLAGSQDHKRLKDGDQGPNTGGMGAYSPAPILTEEMQQKVMKKIINSTIAGMKEEGRPFTGVLYAGLMINKGEPYVLEFNVRFGDPEAQVLLPRLETDWLDLLEASLEKKLHAISPRWTPRSAVCVVMAAKGYPDQPEKGEEIRGLDQVGDLASVYHAGTEKMGGKFVTAGGRVLGITALGFDLKEAVKNCYAAVGKIYFNGMQYRRDIAAKGLKGS